MNEVIEIRFQKNGRRLRVQRQLPGGIEFDERDPIERTVGIQFSPANAVTDLRLKHVRRVQGWDPGQFKLNMSVEDGSIRLRGVTPHALPAGRYEIRLQVEEAKTPKRQLATVDDDATAVATFEIALDDREVAVDLSQADERIKTIIDRSRIDGASAEIWLSDKSRRPTRRACMLNLMAALRTRPSRKEPLIALVQEVFLASNDRIYAKVDAALLGTLEALAKDPARKFYAEGKPHAAIHGKLLSEMPEPSEIKTRFTDLLSFRAEGSPSMQAVVAVPPPDLGYTYAEFDLDLGNPLQDLAGFFVHMGELFDGKPTNHLDMREKLRAKAQEFLYYAIV